MRKVNLEVRDKDFHAVISSSAMYHLGMNPQHFSRGWVMSEANILNPLVVAERLPCLRQANAKCNSLSHKRNCISFYSLKN
jgi:hypothetical protein